VVIFFPQPLGYLKSILYLYVNIKNHEMEDLSNTNIIEALKHQAEEHERISKKIREAIQNLEEINNTNSIPQKKTPKMIRTKPSKSKGYEKSIINIFNDGFPRTARELQEELQDVLKRKIMFTTFSGRLSEIKKNGNIRIHTFPQNPLTRRYYYGLQDWFEGDQLKEEYIKKIKMHYDERPRTV